MARPVGYVHLVTVSSRRCPRQDSPPSSLRRRNREQRDDDDNCDEERSMNTCAQETLLQVSGLQSSADASARCLTDTFSPAGNAEDRTPAFHRRVIVT